MRLWQEIALALLKKYTERYYTFRKREWELPHLEYQDLTADDPNFPGSRDDSGGGHYRIPDRTVAGGDRRQAGGVEDRHRKRVDLKPWEFQGLKAIWFGRHLYQPLLYLDSNIVEISPVPLNKGERRFVEDLKAFHDNNGRVFCRQGALSAPQPEQGSRRRLL